jgi:hypothetical protein
MKYFVKHDNSNSVSLWHFAAFAAPQKFVAYWTNNGQWAALGLIGSAANDP